MTRASLVHRILIAVAALLGSMCGADDSRSDTDLDETTFLHTEKLVLIDGAGHLRGIYNGTQPHGVDQLIGDLTALGSSTGRGL